MAKLLLQNRSFIRCRNETQGEGHCKTAKKTMETQIELTKTAIELARLDNRGNIRKAEISRKHKTQSSVRKQASSFDAVQKKNQEAVHLLLTTKKLKISTQFKITAVYLSRLGHRTNNTRVEN